MAIPASGANCLGFPPRLRLSNIAVAALLASLYPVLLPAGTGLW